MQYIQCNHDHWIYHIRSHHRLFIPSTVLIKGEQLGVNLHKKSYRSLFPPLLPQPSLSLSLSLSSLKSLPLGAGSSLALSILKTAMAETPSQQTPTPTQTQSVMDPDPMDYWCYNCGKQVSIETLADRPDVICQECKHGFGESIVAANPPPQAMPPRTPDRIDELSFSSQFLQVLRLIAQAAREEDNDDDDEGNEGKVRNEGEDGEEEENNQDRSDGENEDNGNRDERDEEDMLRLRLRIRDLVTRAANRQDTDHEGAEIFRQLGDPSIPLRVQVHEVDDYVGNPEDYVDAASDNGGRRGAPPAAKSALMALQTMEITPGKGSLVCAICKDSVNVGEVAKKLPCGHGYHKDCIVPWLGSRNSCPLCRSELETDDPEYEEERKKRATANLGSGPSSSAG